MATVSVRERLDSLHEMLDMPTLSYRLERFDAQKAKAGKKP